MSTTMQTPATPLAFDSPEAVKKPARACIGTIAEIGEAKETSSGRYIQQPFVLKALHAGMDTKGNIFYRPEWLRPGAMKAIQALTDADLKRSMEFTYRTHIAASDDIPTLAGLCGSSERYAKLSQLLCGLENPTMESVREVLRRYLLDQGEGQQVGYVMTQRREKTDEVDENGKQVRRLSQYYDIGRWFYPGDEKAIKRLVKSAQQGKLLLTFEV